MCSGHIPRHQPRCRNIISDDFTYKKANIKRKRKNEFAYPIQICTKTELTRREGSSLN